MEIETALKAGERLFAGVRIRVALAVLLVLSSAPVQAAGTTAGTQISTRASLQCDICGAGGITAEAGFMVDNRIHVTVAESDGAGVSAIAGQMAAVTTFTVTNGGNAVQDYSLSAANAANGASLFGMSDSFDAAACMARAESGAVGGYDAADVDAYLDELAPDASRTVYVVCNIPAGQPTGSAALVSLTATALQGGVPGTPGAAQSQTAAADDPNAVDVVFADAAGSDDAARDGKHSARDAYLLGALVGMSKSVVNVQDPAGCNAASGCRIVPGSILTYRIDLILSGSGNVEGLLLNDPIPAGMSYVPGSLSVNGTAQTDAADGDLADFGVTAPNTVSVAPGTVTAPATFSFTFRATVN